MPNDFKIIHFFNDDKFIDIAIKLIEAVYPNRSTYFIIQSQKEPFKYVKSSKAISLIIANQQDELNLISYIQENKIEVAFFHALNLKKQRLVNVLDKNLVKVWFIWGYDLYSNWPLLNRYIYDKETLFFLSTKNYKSSFKHTLISNNITFWLFSMFRNKKHLLPKKVNTILNNNYSTEFYKATQKIDIVVPVIPNEYNLVKKMRINPVYAPFTYGCLEDILGNKINENVLNSKNILIGNSGDPANNHIDAFKKIAKFNLKGKKIIVPLSYGGSKDYIQFVIEKGNYFFGENFMPLLNFMPLQEYNQLISSCGFVIFNHIRQQAVGNIITLGYMGAKIFLNDKSPVFKYYKSLGISVYSIKDLNEISLKTNLNSDEFKNNKHLLFENYSNEAVKNKIKDLFSIVDKELNKKQTI